MRLPKEYYCIGSNSTIKEAMKSIDKNLTSAVFITNQNNQVIGLLTDGDIRRALIKGNSIDSSIETFYNRNFKYAAHIESKRKIKEYMLLNKIRQLPILDENRKLTEVCFLDDIITFDKKENYVFILAGGLGTRLRPLTETIPKPMLNVGDKPILEHIIESFKEYGFENFIISLNYKGNMIEEYFGDGKNLDVSIEYVREKSKLGTAGSIKLAQDKLTKPFVVINGDIITKVDFDAFLNHHINNRFDVTVGVRNYELKVPYGVMITENMMIKSLEEKPTYNFFINSGIYAVNPNLISYIPKNKAYNMTDLINRSIEDNYKPGIYQITEYWADIGQMEDYRKANEDIKKL